ncbi:MAG TPA: hypothetical protein VFA81_06200 [Burkholderiales bacterium]|nr:hypothetical protein [Burkholderiales bacterium]
MPTSLSAGTAAISVMPMVSPTKMHRSGNCLDSSIPGLETHKDTLTHLMAVQQILPGRRQRSPLPEHRKTPRTGDTRTGERAAARITRAGHNVAARALSFYNAVGQRLARNGRRA